MSRPRIGINCRLLPERNSVVYKLDRRYVESVERAGGVPVLMPCFPSAPAARAFMADLQVMKDLVADPRVDLLEPLPHGDGQTVLREALLVADHNAYHLGQLVTVRRALGAWPRP